MKQLSLSLRRPRVFTRRYARNCWFMLCCVLALVTVYALRGRASSDAKAAAPPVTLRGEEAVAHLRQEGSYDSLAAAMAATRYQVHEIKRPGIFTGSAWRVVNAEQRLKADFTSGEVSIAQYDKAAQQAGASHDWQVAMRLTEYGYGDRLSPVSEGKVNANGSRIEFQRTAMADTSAKITEWYVNEAKGLEQGFTLNAPPSLAGNIAGEKLRLRLALSGDLRAKMSSDGQSVALLNRHDVQVLNYGGLVVRDALGRELEARMTASDNEVVIETDDAGAVYPVVIDPIFTQFNKLTASDGTSFDYFGDSMALDGNTAVIGAFANDIDGKEGQGAAYVFVRTGTNWTQQQKLIASDGAANDYFGRQLALSGDTVLIGASSDDINGNIDQGSAYVFVRSGTTWTQQQKLIDVDGAAGDQFGETVALSGDTAVIGAAADDIGGNVNQGSVQVFVRNGTTWIRQQKLLSDDGAEDDGFGSSVAISGNTILAGASGAKINGNLQQGAVYSFEYTGTIWTQQQKFTASDGAARQFFGQLIVASGDTALIGRTYQQGRVYVFVRIGTTWVQQQQLSSNSASPNFGSSLALDGDTALVGDVGNTGDPQGTAYVFTRSGAMWTQQQKLTASDGQQALFGISVALGGNTALIGARSMINGNLNQGAAYQFSISSIYPQQAMLVASDGVAGENFGRALALSGNTAVVANYLADRAGILDRGVAYVFVRSGSTWTLQQQLFASDGEASDYFSSAVAVDGDTAVIGASGDDTGANTDQGSAYVFVRSGTTWTQQQKLLASDGAGHDFFGYTVALKGDTALVGAYGKNGIRGAAYAFVRSGTTWTQQQKLTAADADADDYFGISVALDGNTAVIGAAGDDTGANVDQGSAYVYVRNGTIWAEQQKLTAGDGAANDNFGISVAVSGDSALIGAFIDDVNGNADQGSAYVYVRSGTTWTQQQKLTASDGFVGDNFGVGVALDGDTALIGAWKDGINENGLQGSAYIFIRSGTTWTQQQKLFASDGAANDQFGYAVSLSGGKALVGSLYDDVNGNADQGSAYIFGESCPTITITPGTLPAGTAGTPYNQSLTGSGGSSPYSFAVITGNPPNGVTLSNSGLFSGTPTAFGSFNFTVRATDNNGCQGTQAYTLQVNPPCGTIVVNPTTLPNGTIGTAYNQTMTATGGTGSYSFMVSAGSLPGGVTLATSGALTGTPNATGAFNFTVKATDANGCMGTRAYTVVISAAGSNGLQFYPLSSPVRLLDTRAGASACTTPGAPIAGGTTLLQSAAGTCGIPTSAKAVTGNVTVVLPSATGFLTLYPSSAAQPTVANTNFIANEVINNVFTLGLGTGDGAFKVFASTTAEVVIDITGYYAPPGAGGLYFHPLPKPIRLLETRAAQPGCFTPGTPLAGGVDTVQQGTTTCDGVTIPATAKALVGNATTVFPATNGFITLYPADAASRPLAASGNYRSGTVLNSPFTVGLSASGQFKIYSVATTDLVIDVLGYFSADATDGNGAGLLFTPLTPARLLDTRPGAMGACFLPGAALTGGVESLQAARNVCTIPNAAQAIVGNATTVQPTANGFLTFWPSNAASRPLAATSNYQSGRNFNRYFTTGLGTDGAFKMYASQTTNLVVDVSGYFAP
ncbi:MAG: putative Ig domain-containing protein [Acidobacteria bacterium]|nr:putative Ig domain-containing protein [Acidobacteriota bacterium]